MVECASQLSKLAAENTTLKAALAEQDRKARSDLQDLRKFCLASLERDTSQDDKELKKLQQEQQLLITRLDGVEAIAKESSTCTANIFNRLDKVNIGAFIPLLFQAMLLYICEPCHVTHMHKP